MLLFARYTWKRVLWLVDMALKIEMWIWSWLLRTWPGQPNYPLKRWEVLRYCIGPCRRLSHELQYSYFLLANCAEYVCSLGNHHWRWFTVLKERFGNVSRRILDWIHVLQICFYPAWLNFLSEHITASRINQVSETTNQVGRAPTQAITRMQRFNAKHTANTWSWKRRRYPTANTWSFHRGSWVSEVLHWIAFQTANTWSFHRESWVSEVLHWIAFHTANTWSFHIGSWVSEVLHWIAFQTANTWSFHIARPECRIHVFSLCWT